MLILEELLNLMADSGDPLVSSLAERLPLLLPLHPLMEERGGRQVPLLLSNSKVSTRHALRTVHGTVCIPKGVCTVCLQL